MKRSGTSTFCASIRIYESDQQYLYLERIMRACQKIYNTCVKHAKKQLELLYSETDIKDLLEEYYKNTTDKTSKRELNKVIKAYIQAYGIDENNLQKYANYQRKYAFNQCVGANIIQKQATALAKAIEKAIYCGTDIHFRKHGETTSFEDKSANTGIVYLPDEHAVRIMGQQFRLKPIRENDTYLQEALCNRVKYCRIVRKPFKNRNKYFLQLILEGYPPYKFKLGDGKCGIDEGVSTVAYYNKNNADFVVLSDGVERYEKEVQKAARTLERRRRKNNPDNYDDDGTVKVGKLVWHYTNGMRKAKQELKNAYRRKHEFIKQQHNKIATQIAKQCNEIIIEPMNYAALARRSKCQAERSDKTTVIIKNGKTKTVHQFKKKKRFGKSVGRRAPFMFKSILTNKIKNNGGTVVEVDLKEYKASQYNHSTKEAIKPSLSDRIKQIDGHIVQRDLYSAFLLMHYKDEKHINFEECQADFNNFIKKQSPVIEKIKSTGDITKNFGIKYFN